jgi:hypothetical protein
MYTKDAFYTDLVLFLFLGSSFSFFLNILLFAMVLFKYLIAGFKLFDKSELSSRSF